jgi:hypothetical protein
MTLCSPPSNPMVLRLQWGAIRIGSTAWTGLSFRAPAREEWRPTVDLAGQTLREAAAGRERKAWRTGVLQPSTASSAHGEMALGPPKRRHFAAFSATFSSIFPVFIGELALEGAFGRECDLETHFS